MSQFQAAFYEGNQRIRIGECTPLPPKPSEVQIRVSYCGICGTDLHLFHGPMDHRVHVPQSWATKFPELSPRLARR